MIKFLGRIERAMDRTKMTFPPISRETLVAFSEASGDRNPLHLRTESAQAAGYDDVIAHGMLIAAYAARAIEKWFPDRRIHRLQTRFTRVTRLNDVITISVESAAADDTGEHYTVTACDQRGEIKLQSNVVLTVPSI
jgi:acyl dehydratase